MEDQPIVNGQMPQPMFDIAGLIQQLQTIVQQAREAIVYYEGERMRLDGERIEALDRLENDFLSNKVRLEEEYQKKQQGCEGTISLLQGCFVHMSGSESNVVLVDRPKRRMSKRSLPTRVPTSTKPESQRPATPVVEPVWRTAYRFLSKTPGRQYSIRDVTDNVASQRLCFVHLSHVMTEIRRKSDVFRIRRVGKHYMVSTKPGARIPESVKHDSHRA